MDALIIKTVIAGVVATSIMTAWMYLLSYFFKRQWKVIHILGTMILNKTTVGKNVSTEPYPVIIGTVLHYLVGIGFSFLYWYLLKKNCLTLTINDSLLFGAVAGIFAVFAWRAFFYIHKNPPGVPLPGYLASIFAGHLVFAEGVMYSYTYFAINIL